jgi:catechol 2,3-dioxygenase-like lactoylglutathione lyase family enzyme
LQDVGIALSINIAMLVALSVKSCQEFPMRPSHALIAILPCNDLDASEAFYSRLGFTRPDSEKPAKGNDDSYRMLSDGRGGHLHLTDAVEGWLIPGRNPFGLYFYAEDIDALAAEFAGETVEKNGPEHKPWGMYEFSLSDPDETLVRIGRRS